MDKEERKYQLKDLTEKEFKDIIKNRYIDSSPTKKRDSNIMLGAFLILVVGGFAAITGQVHMIFGFGLCIGGLLSMWGLTLAQSQKAKKAARDAIAKYQD